MPVTSEAFRVEVASLGILVCLTLDSLNLQHLPGLGVLHHFSGISFSSREKKKYVQQNVGWLTLHTQIIFQTFFA